MIAIKATGVAAVTCLEIGALTTATWTNAKGKHCTWTGKAGSNFGDNADGGEYVLPRFPRFLLLLLEVKYWLIIGNSNSCNGRCGEGCGGFALGNV